MKVKFIKRILLFLAILSINNIIHAQINYIAYPSITQFERSTFQAGIQSWMISQNKEGLLYFANNDGLLEFDGKFWKLYPVPNKTIIRSVLADTSGKIYVGSSNDFGYFERKNNGKLEYHSYLNILNINKNDFEEIWKIHKIDDGIVFQSYKSIIIVKDNKYTIIKAPTTFHFSFLVKNNLYVVDKTKGILLYKNKKLNVLIGTRELQDFEITSILPYNNKLLITTLDNGVYIYDGKKTFQWKNDVTNFLKKNQIYCAIRINENSIAFGTIQNGLLICSNDGKINLHLNETKGLQNNTILCMNKDINGNLWVGTDNGIDLIKINSPFRLLNKYNGISAGYTAIKKNNILYLGTNRGVFYKYCDNSSFNTEEHNNFKLIEATKGQVWKLQIIDGQLFCGHNNGIYLIDGIKSTKICDIPGIWTFINSTNNPNKIIAGTYNGLILLKKTPSGWKFSSKIYGFNQSSRIMAFDDDESIWMSHGFKGVYHIFLNDELNKIKKVDFYDKNKGFETNYGINLTKIGDKIVFLTPNGIYQYNRNKNEMQLSDELNSIFQSNEINYTNENLNGDIWFFSGKHLFVLRHLEDGTYSKISLPFRPLHGKFIGGFEYIYTLSDKNILIGSEKGFIIYNQNFNKNYQREFKTFFRAIKIPTLDTNLLEGKIFVKNSEIPKLEYKNNGLHFFFSAIDNENPDELKFSTYLKGYDLTWSDWENRRDKEYTNLKEGNYSFFVKAKNIYNVETKPITYEFSIKPPFSRSKLAYSIYVILFIISIFVLIYVIIKRIEKVKLREEQIQKDRFKELERKLQREKIIREKEIIKLKNEKLKQEMKNKNKELAESTMQTIRKNKFLINIKNDLGKILNSISAEKDKRSIKMIVKKLNKNINNEDNWKVFETHFLNVHEEFITRLKKAYPQLTHSELRLCACLRMNLSSKEIGNLFNISVRGVETSRYRLRKALNLDRKENLTDYILSF